MLFVCTSLFSVSELNKFGETATLEVARMLLGDWGALIVVTAGLLAMISSANASIMSSSRTIYALGKDQLLPAKVKKVNQKFNSPQNALLLVTAPILAMLFLNDLEFFAEVASFLHLLIYGSICVTLFKLRSSGFEWYKPKFMVSYGRVIAVLGALCSFGLIVFMNMKSILAGVVVVVGAMIYYYFFRRNAEISKPDNDLRED